MTHPCLIPIMEVECHEPGPHEHDTTVSIKRTISSLVITPETMKILWEKSKVFPTLFNQSINADFSRFCEVFLSLTQSGELTTNGLFYVVDDFVGVYYLTDIYPALDAQAHYTFFDRRHRGRVDMTKAMLGYLFKEFGFQRLSTTVPLYAKEQTFNFVERVGFKKEGRRRKSAVYKEQLWDENLYGILRSECLKEEGDGSK